MGVLQPLEKPLEDINKSLPELPKSLRDLLAKIAPWLTLLGALLAAWSAYSIWDWTRNFGAFANWVMNGNASSNWTLSLYLAVGILIASAIIYAVAFSPLKEFKKKGWDLLFLAVAVNFLYGIVILFGNNYGGAGSFFGQLIGTAISLYILFQIRDYYTGKAKIDPTPPVEPTQTPPQA